MLLSHGIVCIFGLIFFVQRCTFELKSSEELKNDERFVSMWVAYVSVIFSCMESFLLDMLSCLFVRFN
jgi:hypothetical protein